MEKIKQEPELNLTQRLLSGASCAVILSILVLPAFFLFPEQTKSFNIIICSYTATLIGGLLGFNSKTIQKWI